MEYVARERHIEPLFIEELHRDIDPRSDARAVRRVLRLIHEFKPDILHTHTAKAGAVGRIAALRSGPDRPKAVVHTFHGHVLRGYFNPAVTATFRQVERQLARSTDALIAVSPEVRDDLVSFGVAPADRIEVVRLGLDLDARTAVPPNARAEVRASLDVPDDSFLVGWFGRMTEVKRVDDLLRSFALLAVSGRRRAPRARRRRPFARRDGGARELARRSRPVPLPGLPRRRRSVLRRRRHRRSHVGQRRHSRHLDRGSCSPRSGGFDRRGGRERRRHRGRDGLPRPGGRSRGDRRSPGAAGEGSGASEPVRRGGVGVGPRAVLGSPARARHGRAVPETPRTPCGAAARRPAHSADSGVAAAGGSEPHRALPETPARRPRLAVLPARDRSDPIADADVRRVPRRAGASGDGDRRVPEPPARGHARPLPRSGVRRRSFQRLPGHSRVGEDEHAEEPDDAGWRSIRRSPFSRLPWDLSQAGQTSFSRPRRRSSPAWSGRLSPVSTVHRSSSTCAISGRRRPELSTRSPETGCTAARRSWSDCSTGRPTRSWPSRSRSATTSTPSVARDRGRS